MSCFVKGNGALLVVGHHLCLLLQTAYDTVHGVKEVLLAHSLVVMTCGNEGCLVADVGDISTGESRSLT